MQISASLAVSTPSATAGAEVVEGKVHAEVGECLSEGTKLVDGANCHLVDLQHEVTSAPDLRGLLEILDELVESGDLARVSVDEDHGGAGQLGRFP